MSWICLFRPHRWLWYFNIPGTGKNDLDGVYQCQRCKTLGLGIPYKSEMYPILIKDPNNGDIR
jgi:hypothetical protein